MRVFKYELPLEDKVTLTLPVGAKVLSVAAQGDGVFLWALVDDHERKTEDRIFRIAGTGHPIDDEEAKHYVGTAHGHRGVFVWHVFEIEVEVKR